MKLSVIRRYMLVVISSIVAVCAMGALTGCTPQPLQPKSSSPSDYIYPLGKPPAPAPSGEAELRAPTEEVNVIGLVISKANPSDVVFEQASVNPQYGTGFVSFKLSDAAYERYVQKLEYLRAGSLPYDAGALEIYDLEAKAVMTDEIRAQLARLNGDRMPEVVFYQIRAVPTPIDGAPTAENPGQPIKDPDGLSTDKA